MMRVCLLFLINLFLLSNGTYKNYKLSSLQCSPDSGLNFYEYANLSEKLYQNSVVRLNSEEQENINKIPKIIHFIWLGGKLPYIYNFCINSWIKLHPDWKVILWNDENVNSLQLQNKAIYEALDNYGAKVDVLLLEIIKKFGGIYVDIDFFCLRSFDEYVDKSSLLVGNMFSDCVGYGLIGACPDHAFINYAISKLGELKTGNFGHLDHTKILETTGPIYITRCFYEYLCKYPDHTGITLLSPSWLYSFPNTQRDLFWNYNKSVVDVFKEYAYKETLAIHLWSVSWVSPRKNQETIVSDLCTVLNRAGFDFINIHSRNKNGETALHILARKSKGEDLKILLAAGIDINAVDNNNRTPLMHAIEVNNFQVVKALIEYGARIDIVDNNGYDALKFADLSKLKKIRQYIFSHKDKVVHSRISFPLIQAVKQKNIKEVEIMLRYGYDVNVCDHNGMTPLFYAVAEDNLDMVQLLILSGANYADNLCDNNGKNIRKYASSEVLLLLDRNNLLKSSFSEPKIVVLTCSYNNRSFCRKNLESIFKQNYSNWELYYVDDCSSDGTGELVASIVHQYGVEDKVRLVRNNVRMRAMANVYNAIHELSDNTIVVVVDGDDWLIDNSVLQYIANLYRDPNVWLTYGSYVCSNLSFPVYCADVSARCGSSKSFFRKEGWMFSHLRTFYAGLFKKIKKEDLMQNGVFFPTACDIAMMIPMLEMCKGRFKFVNRVLYVYNDDNPICDYKVESSTVLPDYIRTLPPYEPIEELFNA